MTLNKSQLANLLAHALNALNDAQHHASETGNTKLQGDIHNVLARVPRCILEATDYANNGTVHTEDILMNLK